MTLTMAPVGVELKVCKVTGKDDMRSRLANLGFVEGAMVNVVSELQGNVIIDVKDTRIALDKTLSNRIIVKN